MTATLYEALKRMSVIYDGFVVRNLDGTAKTDKQAVWALARICRLAGLPERQWHTLRHYPDRRIIPHRVEATAGVVGSKPAPLVSHAG